MHLLSMCPVGKKGFVVEESRVLRDALNTRVPAEMRATANSVAALGMRLVFAFVGPAVGFGMDSVGIESTLRILAGVFALLLPLVCFPLIRAWRRDARAPT